MHTHYTVGGNQYGYSELYDISHYRVKVMCAELLFAEKWPPTKAIGGHFPQKAAPHTSLSQYHAKYQRTRNSRITTHSEVVECNTLLSFDVFN